LGLRAFSEIKCEKIDSRYPDLTTPWMKSPVPISTIMNNIVDIYRLVAKDLLEKPDADTDSMERLVTIARVLPYLSMEELRSLWEQIKGMDEIYL
jgi:hypothetical protein